MLTVDLVPHSDNDRELVVFGVIALAICGSYSKISSNCVFLQLAIGKYLLQMIVDGMGVCGVA
jgi:hypothetical protein